MPYAKAIVAFIVPLLVAPLAFLGIDAETTVGTALEIILVAAITAMTVYLVPNK